MPKSSVSSTALQFLKKESVEFLLLQFTDILGSTKNVEVPKNQFEAALAGQVVFDGSSLESFARRVESELLLKPDLGTLRILEESEGSRKTARLICDISNLDNTPFPACPRTRLKMAMAEAGQLGYQVQVAPEIEFFLFLRNVEGKPTTQTHDTGSYFDLAPLDQGEQTRKNIVKALEPLGIRAGAIHHEIAPGQHEIDLQCADPLETADNIGTLRVVARKAALQQGLHATFMPKPVYGQEGSGLHLHLYLTKNGKNSFFDPQRENQLSLVALYFIGGLLGHARGFTLVTNPLINSYKRLVPGFDAPTHSVWSEQNVNPLVWAPPDRGPQTRCELRSPDPACNPYLALSVILKAGLDGLKNKMDPGPPINKNIYRMSARERGRYSIDPLPMDVDEALHSLKKDKVVQQALGEEIYKYLVEAQSALWTEYTRQVHPWELQKYLSCY